MRAGNIKNQRAACPIQEKNYMYSFLPISLIYKCNSPSMSTSDLSCISPAIKLTLIERNDSMPVKLCRMRKKTDIKIEYHMPDEMITKHSLSE